MLKLIGNPKSRAFRVLWLLEELELPFELLNLPPHAPEVFALNPSGKIPALLDGEDCIIDSAAICHYLADKHQKITFPAGTIERAKQDSFTFFALDDFETPLWTYSKNIFALPKDQRVPQILDQCKAEFAKALKTFETRLGENEYVMGDTFTIADIFITHCMTWAKSSRFEIPEGPAGNYLKNARSRPAYLRASNTRSEFQR
ncbi:MAG: glutathione S-transferase family protein [Devosiaceae bacterium]|nr:glutathione S-transferase family protein [Devosiaceae bacterium]